MAVTAVVFDVGETLVDETRQCEEIADASGVPRFTFMSLCGTAIAQGRQPQEHVFALLGVEPPEVAPFTLDDLYPDALPCLRRLRGRGLVVAAAGNMREANEDFIRPHVDVVGSSSRWGVRKPTRAFFDRIVVELDRPASEIAYVGDRVDNDVAPALEAGFVAVHVRRGPWGYLREPPAGALRVDLLDELPGMLA